MNHSFEPSFLTNLYLKSLEENDRNVRLWEDYLQSLKSLDFSIFSDKLKVPALVPIGSRIFFRGELKHTNEVTVALGANYFVKCSIKQAETIRDHRIKDAESKLKNYKKEKEYLENQISFSKRNIFHNEGKEIIEFHTEEEERIWREKHRQNVKEYTRNKEIENTTKSELTDEELWNRLEELELQEELLESEEHNYEDAEFFYNNLSKTETMTQKEVLPKEESQAEEVVKKNNMETNLHLGVSDSNNMKNSLKINSETIDNRQNYLMQQILEKQQKLEEKLQEIKSREWVQSKSEQDLIAKLDEMDELDELEDEMEKLDDIINDEDIQNNESEFMSPDIKRNVAFAADDENETLEIVFTHSTVEPSNEAYHPQTGITKPSDVYLAFANLFKTDTTSILKKSKYNKANETLQKDISPVQSTKENKTVEIKDVVERNIEENSVGDAEKRPISLFKKKRQQMKAKQ